MFGHLSPQSRYQRFLYPKHELSRQELDEFTCLDHWHHDALIAWLARPRTPVGIGRYVRADDFDCAEIAITVIDEWQRHGIGGALLSTLRDRAVRAGIRRFTSTSFSGNRAALRLAHQLGSCQQVRSAGGVVELECTWR
jgi:acetyltransferase